MNARACSDAERAGTTPRGLPRLGLLVLALVGSSTLLSSRSRGDEGMWLFNRLPLESLRENHGFEPKPGWAESLLRSAVRISSGGSGSFVSPRGLVLTNHHVGSEALQKLGTPERDLLKDGFLARTLEEELRCPELEILSLVEIVDVTERVNAAVPEGSDPAAAGKARRESMASIEKESKDSTGLTSDVVTLYGGGEYHLYRYKRYEDVRLVMAPETDVAFFGGDLDNFEYPRYCLDICFFRVYEDGEPARVSHYLPWSERGAEAGDLVFVVGHPGRTSRSYTLDHLRFLRDADYPFSLEVLAQREITLEQFGLRGAESERMAREDLFGIQNARKARRGGLAGLLDPEVFVQKAREEAELQGAVALRPEIGASLEDWHRVAGSRSAFREFYVEYQLLEGGRAFWSDLFRVARTLVRLAEESEKPNAERLPGFRESDLETLDLYLYSPAPIHPELEVAKLADSLTLLATRYGAEHPLTRMVLAGKPPARRGRELVAGTSLRDVEARREVARGGKLAIQASEDPMIALARSVDPLARGARGKYEDLVEGVEREAYARISRAQFQLRGTGVYPDATFTLRLSFGVVKGYREAGRDIPPFTTVGGAFEKLDEHGGADPYRLPETWRAARDRLDAATPFNFVSTADIIGGNSGSPVVSRSGAVVGLIFDGNIQSLVLDYHYTEEQARAVSVSSQVIVEALEKVYRAGRLRDEILGARRL